MIVCFFFVPNSSRTNTSPFCVVHFRIFCNSINSLINKIIYLIIKIIFFLIFTLSFSNVKQIPSRQTCKIPPSPVLTSFIGNSPPNS
jgi:hypothetical protein